MVLQSLEHGPCQLEVDESAFLTDREFARRGEVLRLLAA